MQVVVFGGSGLIGSKVVDLLQAQGHTVVAATRKQGVAFLKRPLAIS